MGKREPRLAVAFTMICLASSKDWIEMPASDDQLSIKQQSSSIITSTNSSSQDIKPPAAGRKRALLCWVTYSGAGDQNSGLKGPVNDVKKIKEMLIKHFGYTDDQNCIRVLTEDQDQINIGNELSTTTPTKKNIEDSLKWLVEGSEFGDSLVFFFSGHCILAPHDHEVRSRHDHSENINTLTNIGSNETHHFCLVDCTGKGMIPNSYINSTIVRPLKEGVTLYAIVDACHSGSILDLKYTYDQQSSAEGRWIDKLKSDDDQSKAEKGTSGSGLAICLSACRDDRTTRENNANSGELIAMGAMTYHLIDMVIEKHPANVTYKDILKKMHDLHDVPSWNETLESISRTLRDLSENQKIEKPVLSSSLDFEVSTKKFLL